MNTKAPPETIRAQSCGACSYLHVRCLTNCFWAPYIKRGEESKFSLLIRDTTAEIFKARVKKCRIERRQKYIDNQYKTKMEMSEQTVLAAESLNQHEGIAVVDVAEHSLNHHGGEVVHDSGTGLETSQRVLTPLSTKSRSNVAKDSLNHCERPVKRVCFPQPTESRFFFGTPIPLAENAVGPSEKVVPLAEKAVDRSADNALLLLAQSAEITEFTDMFTEEQRTKILELKKHHGVDELPIIMSKIANYIDQEFRTGQEEQASLRNEKAEQSEKEQASLRNETAEQAEKEHAKRSEK